MGTSVGCSHSVLGTSLRLSTPEGYLRDAGGLDLIEGLLHIGCANRGLRTRWHLRSHDFDCLLAFGVELTTLNDPTKSFDEAKRMAAWLSARARSTVGADGPHLLPGSGGLPESKYHADLYSVAC